MINRAVLVGRLTKDPELRKTSNDTAVTSFRLAVNRAFTNRQGEREADFIQVVVWRRQAENVAKYVKKGSLVGVEGRIQTRSYDDQQGVRKFIVEVVADNVQFLDTKNTAPSGNSNYDDAYDYNQSNQQSSYNQNTQNTQSNSNQNSNQSDLDDIDIAEDDLPF
ncbi:MAG: single-stranded DNA-binding protein [Bacillota bacterium]